MLLKGGLPYRFLNLTHFLVVMVLVVHIMARQIKILMGFRKKHHDVWALLEEKENWELLN
jgi:hypothetical protein